MSVSWRWFSLCEAFGRLLIGKVVLCSYVFEHKTILNTKYFIINSKIIALCSHNRSEGFTCTLIHTSCCLLESEDDKHTLMPTFDRACTNAHTFQGTPLFSTSKSTSITYRQVAIYWRFGWWWQTHIHSPTVDYLQKHLFLFYVYMSVSLTRMQRRNLRTYFTSVLRVLSRDGQIADCTVRQPGVEFPFSSFILKYFCECWVFLGLF